jgi:hypothetical protein
MMFWLWFSAVVPMLAWPAPLYDARYRTLEMPAPVVGTPAAAIAR